jgi:parvulin-like peptidyl-prolyl isomerase/Tfp pilus assembly protein PilF
MQSWILWLLALILSVFVLLVFSPFGQINTSIPTIPKTSESKAVETKAYLTVNGQSIDQDRIEEAYQQYLTQQTQLYQQYGQDLEAQLSDAGDGAYLELSLKATALQQLIDTILIEQEQGKLKISVTEKEILEKTDEDYQRILQLVRERNGWDEKALAEFLQSNRQLTLEQFKNQIREQAQKQLIRTKTTEVILGNLDTSDESLIAYIEENRDRYAAEILEEVDLDEEQIKAYYEKNKSNYAKTLYKTSHILVAVEADAASEKVEAAKKKALEIRDKLTKQAADFAELAKEFSDDPGSKELGGDLGLVDKDTPFAPEFLVALLKLNAEQISEPVRSQFGFHIIKAVEKKESTYDDVREEVESDYSAERQDQLFSEWVQLAKKKQAPRWQEIAKTVRADWLAATSQKKLDAWLQESRRVARLTIGDELMQAALYEKEGKTNEALALYEKLAQAKSLVDLYTPYYAARIYQARLAEAESRKAELEKTPSPTQSVELKKVSDQIALFTRKSIEYLTQIITGEAKGNAKLFDTLIGFDDQNPLVHYKYGLWLYGENTIGDTRSQESNKTREALAHIRRAIELKPDYGDALITYGNILSSNGNFGTAVEYYEQALPQTKGTALVQLQEKMADAYLGLQSWEKAKTFYSQLNKLQPAEIKFMVALGDIAFETKNYQTAQDFYKKAYEKEPEKIDYSLKLAKSYAKTGSIDKAIALLQTVTKDSPYLGEAWIELGDIHQSRGARPEALRAYRDGFARTAEKELIEKLGEAILLLEPNDDATRLKLAAVYKSQYIYENAIQHFEIVLSHNSSREQKLEALEGLAESMRGRADYEKARNYYISALSITTETNQRIKLNEKVTDMELQIAGPGNPFSDKGKEALFQLGTLYLSQQQASLAQEVLEKLKAMDANFRKTEVQALLEKIKGS